MAFFADAIEEFKTLKPTGKVVVIGILAAAAFIGYEVYRNRGASGSGVNSSAGTGVNPFTITTLTNPAKSSTPAKKAPIILPRLPKRTVNPSKPSKPVGVRPIGPAHPIQTIIQKVTQPVQQVVRPNTNATPKGYVFWNGPTRYSNGVSNVTPQEWMNRAKTHPINSHGTIYGGGR